MPPEDDEGTPPAPPEGTVVTPPETGVSQEKLNRIARQREVEGKRAGQAELLQELGFDNADDVKAFLAAKRAADDKDLSEVERKTKAAEEKERKADEKSRLADETLLNVKVERALEIAGVPAATSSKIRKLVEGVDADSDADTISAAVEALKVEMPHVFAAVEGGPTPPPAHSAPPKTPAPAAPSGDTRTKAQELLRSRHPELSKQ